MTRVLLFATTTGYQIRSFGEAAARLGVRLVLASDRCDRLEDPWWDGAIPVRFHDIAMSVDAVLAGSAGPIDGVLAVGDRPAVLAAHVAEALGIPGHPPAAAEASRNKLQARRAFAAAGLPTPPFHVMSIESAAPVPAVAFPAVVKPLMLSGSRGVMRVDGERGLAEAIERLGRLLRSPDVALERDEAHASVLIESFIPGREYAVEGLLTGGTLQVLAIFDKPDPLDGPFFEETIYLTPSGAAPAVAESIVDAVTRAAGALGLRHGAVHAECRVNASGVYVLEVAARPIGGLCAKVLRFEAPGRDRATLEEILLRHALGERVDGYGLAPGAWGVMMIPIPRRGRYRGVAGVESARRVSGVSDVIITAKPGALLLPLPEGRSYLGFIFAHAAGAADVDRALRDAHARLEFTIERDVAMLD